MSLKPIRDEIDSIDEQLLQLFVKRMDCSKRVAEYKLENGLPVFNAEREEAILEKVESSAGEYGKCARQLYSSLMGISRSIQHNMLGSGQKIKNEILCARDEAPFLSDSVRVACFGAEGSYASKATGIVFPNTTPDFYPSFQEVFEAVQNGAAEFGVIPIENSSAGSVIDVYDLMLKYRFYVARAVDIPINHVLAAAKNTDMPLIKKIYSHQQALSQCSHFFRANRSISAESYISTAAAAKMVSESSSDSIAAICSEDAAEKYGLHIIKRGFQNNPSNTTRFIIISKPLYITPDAEKICLCFTLPHKTGSLYDILGRFALLGLNLTKLESRPIFGSSFEYMFYLDFQGNAKDRSTLQLLCALSEELGDFSFLGNYRESM